MKRVGIIVGSAAGFVVIVFALFVTFMDLRTPDTGAVTCPTYVARSLADSMGATYRADRWEVYSFEGAKGAPRVKVRPSSVVPDSRTPSSCELKIAWAPETPGSASDWRIGHIGANPEALRGRSVTFRVLIKGVADFHFDTAQIYVYDGFKVAGAPLPGVTRDWQAFQVTAQVDPGASVFEAWIRLLLDKGTIRPGSGSLYFVATLELQPN